MSPQGFTGAVDHIFLCSVSTINHTTRGLTSCCFPFDHAPVLHDLPPIAHPLCPAKKGRFTIPAMPHSSQICDVNDTFRTSMHTSLLAAVDASSWFAAIASRLTEAAIVTYRPPIQPRLHAVGAAGPTTHHGGCEAAPAKSCAGRGQIDGVAESHAG